MNPPDHTVSRLTTADLVRLTDARDGWLANYRLHTCKPLGAVDITTVRRVMVNSIGCNEHDLRDTELAIVYALVDNATR